MICISTIRQPLPESALATSPAVRRLLEEFGKLTERAAGWWRQRQIPARPATEQRRRLSSTRELSDHVLRDIGFIDALPPPADPQEDKPY